MNKTWKLAAAACALLSHAALAQDAPPNYATLMGSYIIPDDVRDDDNGIGWHVLYGSPINDWMALEMNAFGTKLDNNVGGESDYQYALGLDFVGSRPSGMFTPFVLAGLGSMFEDFPGSEQISPYVDVGAGVLLGTPWKPLKVRGEGRYYAFFNDESYAGEDMQFDAHLNLGLQLAFGEAKAAPVMAPQPVSQPIQPMDGDSDGDGVPDSADRCPGTPPGQVVDANGCPVDEDQDGVPNDLDKCPHTPYGLRVDANGCAEQGASTVILKSVHFEFDKADLTRDARQALDGIADGMRGQPTMEVELGGHCDALGTQSYNLGLSQRRANSVRDYLISRGIEAGRMKAEGYGEVQPIATNETEEGRAQNRRVEFKVLKQ